MQRSPGGKRAQARSGSVACAAGDDQKAAAFVSLRSGSNSRFIYYLGIPAANHDPDVLRMRSTGARQVLGGTGESVSLMRKSPSNSSGTPAAFELCWIFPSLEQNSVAKTLAPALLPIASPAPRRRPCPSTRMLPSCLTSASRVRITQIWPAAGTPRTVVFVEPVVISPIPPLKLTKPWAMAD